MPFVDFCNGRDPRARPPIPQTPPHLRWQATARRAAPPPEGGGASRMATAQGSRPRRTLDPHLDVRTPKRIYPDLLGPDTPCRSLTPFVAWNRPRRATVRKTVPLAENNEPRILEPKPGDPLGPPLTPARESDGERPHPRCLPPPAQACDSLRCRPASFGHPATGLSPTEPLGPAPLTP
jgi:hypothetical protein